MPDPLGDLAFTWPFYATAALGYLLGSVPSGLLLTRVAGLGDIRTIGSGNIGATNVLRTGNKWLALATLLFDAGKGVAAVLLAGLYGEDMAIMAAYGAVLGHCFPVWLRFKGGKAVATGFGVVLAFDPLLGGLCGLVWLVVAVLFRYSSLAALVALAAAPVFTYYLHTPHLATAIGLISGLLLIRHHANIKRLLTGQESKINLSKSRDGGR